MARFDELSDAEYDDILDDVKANFGSYEAYESQLHDIARNVTDEQFDNLMDDFEDLLVRCALDGWSHEFHGPLHELFVFLEYDDWDDSKGYFSDE